MPSKPSPALPCLVCLPCPALTCPACPALVCPALVWSERCFLRTGRRSFPPALKAKVLIIRTLTRRTRLFSGFGVEGTKKQAVFVVDSPAFKMLVKPFYQLLPTFLTPWRRVAPQHCPLAQSYCDRDRMSSRKARYTRLSAPSHIPSPDRFLPERKQEYLAGFVVGVGDVVNGFSSSTTPLIQSLYTF